MSEMTAREKIAGVIQACLGDGPTPGGERFDLLAERGTDNVIAIVREAMLSEEAIVELRFVDDVGDGMEAALDAAFGAEQ